MSETNNHENLLKILGEPEKPNAEQFKQLIINIDRHQVLAKIFLLEGTPYVFEKSPMKYVIFREQVAERFNVGSQDVCIVGSAKLGFSPTPKKWGTPFSQKSDVDVVIISEELFYQGSQELFSIFNNFEPPLREVGKYRDKTRQNNTNAPEWLTTKEFGDNLYSMKDAIRNFVYENFNPNLLPQDNILKRDIFEKIGSTAGLFLALEPKIFVSKIRCRIFRNWKAAESYYSHTLEQAKIYFRKGEAEAETEIDEDEDILESEQEIDNLVTNSKNSNSSRPQKMEKPSKKDGE